MSKNKISIGNCGEYFVAAELERRGFSVAVPMSNTELFDILAFNRETHKQWAIQVKTSYGKNGWILSSKNENIKDENIIYIFVKLTDGKDVPEYFIVPSKVVAKYIYEVHQNYLNNPGKKGQAHNDSSIRKFHDEKEEYKSKWDYLK